MEIFCKMVIRILNNIYLQIICGSIRVHKIKYFGYQTKKTAVAQNYKINPIQITTIIAEYTKNLLNSVSYTIDIIQVKKL